MPKSGFNDNCGLHVQQDAKLGCENIKTKSKEKKRKMIMVADQWLSIWVANIKVEGSISSDPRKVNLMKSYPFIYKKNGCLGCQIQFNGHYIKIIESRMSWQQTFQSE